MAEKHISRRKLICQVSTVVAAGVVMPAFGAELTNIAEQEWKDRLAIAAVELRETTISAHSLLDEAKNNGNFDFTKSGFCPEYRAYVDANNKRMDAEALLDEIIYEGVKT